MGRRKKILTEEEKLLKEQKELEKKSGVKKRGRKPKNKMPEVVEVNNKKTLDTQIVYQNIILHLKCNKSDIKKNMIEINSNQPFEYNPDINIVQPFNNNDNYCNINDNNIKNEIQNENSLPYPANDINYNMINKSNIETECTDNELEQKVNENKVIHQKLCELEHNLHFNNITKKSNCFWCTYVLRSIFFNPRFIIFSYF